MPADDDDETPKLVERRLNMRKTDALLGFHLRRAQEAAFAAFAHRIGDDHVWPGWFALLMIVHENPEINQTALSRAIGRDKSTLTTSLRELMRRGLVRRTRSPYDGRSYTLRLTDAGEAQLQEMGRHARAHDRQLDAIVGKENKEAFIRILKRIVAEIGDT